MLALAAACAAEPPPAALATDAPSSQFEDVPAPLAAVRPRNAAEREHLEALARFAAGRTHERREEYTQALRCYERAYRLDPQADAVGRAILAVAVRLQRFPEAVRYARKAKDATHLEPSLLRRLGLYLTEQGDYAGALELYEKALRFPDDETKPAAEILLRMEMGRLYHLVNNAQAAAENFAKVYQALEQPEQFGLDEHLRKVLLDKPAGTYAFLGRCFLAANRPEEARAAFRKADALEAKPALLQFHLAQIDAQTGQPEAALKALEACFAAHLSGEGTLPYQTLADVLKQLKRSAELLPRLETLYAADAENIPLAFFLAAQYRTAGQFDKAETIYRDILKRVPARAAYRNLIEVCRETKQYDTLLAALGEAIDSLGVLETLGAEAQTIAKDAEQMRGLVAAARARKQGAAQPLTPGMCQAVAMLAVEAKNFEVAREFFELALAAKPRTTAELLLAWGVGLLMDERSAEAAAVLQRGIDDKALPADNPAFYYYLAGALASTQQTDAALAAARKAAAMGPRSARLRERPAWVLYFSKRYAEAKQAYTELLRDFDSDTSPEARAVLRHARLALSNLCVLDNHLSEAEEWLAQVLDEFPDDVGAQNDLGYLWADANKNLARAQEMIERAVKAEPDNTAYRDSLGWVLYRRGQYAAAVAELEKAARGKKVDGTVLDHLGDAYHSARQPEKARETWQRAAKTLREEKEFERAAAVEKKLKS